MNNVLNLNRLWLLIRRQAVENYKFYLLGMVVVAGLLLVIYGALYRQGLRNDDEFQSILFLFSLCLSGSVFTSLLVRDLHVKTTAIWYLMLPVSALERIVGVLFYCILIFIPIHLLVFYAIDMSFVALFNSRLPEFPPAHVLDLVEKQKYAFFYTLFLILQAATLVGSLYFEKYSYVKTTAAVFAFVVILFYANSLIISAFTTDEVTGSLPFSNFQTVAGEGFDRQWTNVKLPEAWDALVLLAGKYLLTPFLWVVAYFRLREKEV